MVSIEQLRKLDMAKQAGYLLGMAGAWGLYTGLEQFAGVDVRAEQVISLHWVLVMIETMVLVSLWYAFNRDQLDTDNPLLDEEHLLTRN
jgi:nitrate/nitrite transporter NarK